MRWHKRDGVARSIGYGTASQPHSDEGERVSRRLLSVSAVLLVSVVTVCIALAGDQGESSIDVGSAPVLLSNMAGLDVMAKEATDAMISTDERAQLINYHQVHAARTTDLADTSGSTLKPVVNPFPDTFYNVFDPTPTMPHHRWTKKQLREEAKRLILLVREAQNWQDRSDAADEEKAKSTESFLKEATENISKIEQMTAGHVNVIYHGLKVAEAGVAGAAKTTEDATLEIEREENFKKRAVWEILIGHSQKISRKEYEKRLQEQRDLVIKSNIWHDEKLDKVKLNRYADDVGRYAQLMEGWQKGMRGRIGDNTSTFREESVHDVHALRNFSEIEQKDMDEAYTLALRTRVTTLGVLNATKLVSNANDYSAKEISARQEDIDAILAHMRALDQGIGKFETEIQTEEQTDFEQIQELEIRFESMKRKLSTLISALGTVQRTLDEEQAEHSSLVQQQDQEDKNLKDTVADLGPKIHGIISDISDKIKDAGIDYSKSMGTASANLGAVESAHQRAATETETLKDSLIAILKAIKVQQAFADRDQSKTSYADLNAALASVKTQIDFVQTLGGAIAAINSTMTASSQNLTTQLEVMDVNRKKWKEKAQALRIQLDAKATAEIAKEQADMATILAVLKELAGKIKEAKDFKLHILDVQGQLRQELAEMTQSLVALDKRFSDLNAKLEAEIVQIRSKSVQIADPDQMKVATDRVGIQSQEYFDAVKKMEGDLARVTPGEQAVNTKIAAMQTRISSVKNDIDETLKRVKLLLVRHPNLFERISCVCYDGDVLKGKCEAGSLSDTSTCEICPAGSWCVRGVARPCKTFCPGGQVLKGRCPAGSVSDVTTCETSPEGTWSNDGVVHPCRKSCDPGFELRGSCPEGSDVDRTRCASCPDGFFCQNGVASECKTSCDDGLILVGKCKRGETTDLTTCKTSPAGYYATRGVSFPCQTTCPDGKYLVNLCGTGSAQDTSTCTVCPDGTFCKGGKVIPCKTTCADGEELSGACPAGSTDDMTVCTRCPDGNFCKGGKVFECKTTCPDGQELMGRCRKGSTEDTTQCKPCKSDFFCANGVSTACREKCQASLALQGKCAAGSSTDTTACVPCPDNFYCDGLQVTPCKDYCWSGKILNGKCGTGSNADTTTCDVCPANYYCKKGIAYKCTSQCPDGSTLTGVCDKGSQEDTTRCEPCPAKSFCMGGKIEACKTTCPEGQLLQGFCKLGSPSDTSVCVPCPPGSYCVGGKANDCLKSCPNGQILTGVCQGSTLNSCEVCPAGSFCRDGKTSVCKKTCTAGAYLEGSCEEGSSRDKTSCNECPENSFCVDGKKNPCKETCPAGQLFQVKCKSGSQSDTTTCPPCPDASFCTGGKAFPCKTSCPLGQQLVGKCALGSASDTTVCQPCPAGYFCRDGVATACRTTCPDGHKLDGECAEGSVVNVQCKPCRAGVFCARGQELPCKVTCDPGMVLDGFCPAASVSDVMTCRPAPAGSYAVTGVASLCKTMCPPGQMLTGQCPAGSSKDNMLCVPCPEGSWCANGVATPCTTKCPNGKLLTGTCALGSQSDTVQCDPCPSGHFCVNSQVLACKTGCGDGKVLEGECSGGSSDDETRCTPCPAGVYCKGGIQTPCTSTCPAGQELIGFCASGSITDTTSCQPCSAGYFCANGMKFPCKTSCDDGEVFEGECVKGSAHDATTCNVCPIGFFCQEGLKRECKKSCPSLTTMQGSCIAGSVTDTIMCVADETPQPLTVDWFKDRTGAAEVEAMLMGDRSQLEGAEIRLSCSSCGEGYIMGRRRMPLYGAKWLVQWYAAWPAYNPKQPKDVNVHTFPVQGFGEQKLDTIKATMNGVQIDMPPPQDSKGMKTLSFMKFFSHEFVGDELAYRFDFTSSTPEVLARPFIVSGVVTLLRDATTGDEGAGAGSPRGGIITGDIINTLDGKKVLKPSEVNDGYGKEHAIGIYGEQQGLKMLQSPTFQIPGLKVLEDPRLLIFKSSKLIVKVPISQGSFNLPIADGKYTCIATLPGMDAVYDPTCQVKSQKLQKTIFFSPSMAPGMIRAVLTWRPPSSVEEQKSKSYVKDLDGFMLVPPKSGLNTRCEVSWTNKECGKNAGLDKDDKDGGGPETITIRQLREGRYRFKVSEFNGNPTENTARLKFSEAVVSVYSSGTRDEFSVGEAGFIQGNNWYVFTIDGTGKIQQCTADTCGQAENQKNY